MRLMAKRSKQMMSDDEEEDALLQPTPGGGRDRGGASASPSVYPFGVHRQGWPPGLLERARRERAGEPREEEEEDEDGDAGAREGAGPHGRSGKRARQGSAPRADTLASLLPKRKMGKNEPRRKDKSETIGDNLLLVAELQKRAERDARRALKDAERAAKLRASGTGGGPRAMPPDYTAAFRGSIDDDFRIGLALGRKTLSLYADFYRSDILLASPLGLRRILGGEGDKEKDRDTDFLSSIELVVVDGAEHMLQQNWQHVKDIFSLLNATPKRPRETTDFSRVRESTLAGLGKALRQTLLFSAYGDPDLTSLLRRACGNIAGSLALLPSYAGQLPRVVPPVRQVFVRIPGVTSVSHADDTRFAFFRDRLLPELLAESATTSGGGGGATVLSGAASHVLLYVPNYYDYVRVRNLLDSKDAEFVTCSEYSEDKDVARARGMFAAGDTPLLLMTERFHFFRRFRIKGIRHVVWYGPPACGHYYPELLNLVEEATSASLPVSATTLYTRYDGGAVERVVGSDKAGRLLDEGSGKNTFVFV